MAITNVDSFGGVAETSFSLNLGTASGKRQVVVVHLQSNSAIPSAATITIGGTSLSSVATYTFDTGARSGETPGYRYGRTNIFSGDVGKSGSQTVSCSYSATHQSIYAYSYTGVDHTHTSSVGSGSGTTYCSRSFTAGNSGSVTVVAGSMWIVDESPITPIAYSSTTVDLAGNDSGIGHENNANTTVVSGFSWSSRGSCDGYKVVAVLLEVAEAYYQLDPTGASVTVEGGTGTLLEGVVLNPEGAEVTATGGTVSLVGIGVDFFCDPHSTVTDGDGSSWEKPFRKLEDLFGAFTASNGDRGFVKAGRFSDVSEILKPPTDVSIYGGFSRSLRGTDAPIENRMWMTDKTIIDMIDAYGESTPWGCIAYTTPGANQSAKFRIDGFHFYNCQNDQSSTAGYGGAINCNSQDDWKILNCRFVSCGTHSTGYGGAVCISGEGTNGITCQIVNCKFIECEAPGTSLGVGGGGGVALIGANAIVHNCSFESCSGGSGGGLLIVDTADTNTVQESMFDACEAIYKGAAICVLNNSNAVSMLRIRIKNTVDSGTVFYTGSTGTIGPVSIKNSEIHDNAHNGIETSGNGYDNLDVINCTIANNEGTGLISAGSPISDGVRIFNSIIYGNTVAQIAGDVTVCQYSDVEGGHSGTGNINVDPQFAGSDHFEPYALGASTACVDGASSGVSGYDAEDLTGFTRTGTPDMGAIEYHPIIVGTVDAGLYNFDMSSKSPSGSRFVPPAFFRVPYLLQPQAPALRDSTMRGREGEQECYPLWIGSEIEIESPNATIVESYRQVTSQKNFYRSTVGPGSGSGQPSWSDPFLEFMRSSEFSTRGNSRYATDGRPSNGITFPVYDSNVALRYEDIQYAVTHKGNADTDDSIRVFNVWIEGHPQVERVVSDYCAKWLDTSTGVSVADLPVSSGLMKEVVRLLNLLVWESRSPLSVPVFGIYWISGPEGPIV